MNYEKIFYGNLQNYKFVKKLGHGGQGRTFCVLGQDDLKFYCLKIIQKKLYKEREIKFVEQRLLRLPKHKILLKVYECFEDQVEQYQIMEYCECGDVANLLQESLILEKSEILSIGLMVAKQLEVFHSMGFVYQDLKPQNIVFTKKIQQNVYKICDFGSLILHEQKGNQNQVGQTQTRWTTSQYQAPETFLKKNIEKRYDFPIDVWSFGVMLFQLISNRMLFAGIQDFETLENIEKYVENQSEIFQRIDNFVKETNMNAFIKKMIDSDPQQRPKISQVIQFFQNCIDDLNKENPNEQRMQNGQTQSQQTKEIKNLDKAMITSDQMIASAQVLLEKNKQINYLMRQLEQTQEYMRHQQKEIKGLYEKLQNNPLPIVLDNWYQMNQAIHIIKQIGAENRIDVKQYLNQMSISQL